MKKCVYLVFVVLFSLNFISCASKAVYNYEVAPVSVGSQGSHLIKVYSYAKSQDKAMELGKKNAVHAVLFKGIPGGNGVSNQKPMVTPEQYATNKDFFDKFFEDGIFLRYVSLSNDGTISQQDRLKVGNMYKIGIVISVRKDDLRKYLENEGIIKKLGGGIF